MSRAHARGYIDTCTYTAGILLYTAIYISVSVDLRADLAIMPLANF